MDVFMRFWSAPPQGQTNDETLMTKHQIAPKKKLFAREASGPLIPNYIVQVLDFSVTKTPAIAGVFI
jgi:hypothetical protein